MCNSCQQPARLDWAEIEKQLGESARLIRSHAVYELISSTNDWGLQQCAALENLPAVCLAEAQQQGRGRRGREWVSPGSGNIYLSLAWSFPLPVAQLAPLSLAIGVALVRALQSYGVAAQLKWPNDVMVGGRKIAGVLIESRVSAANATQAVIGLGLNYAMNDEDGQAISQAWTDFLREYNGAEPAERNSLVARVLGSMLLVCEEFSQHGFVAFRQEWCGYDMCRGRTVELSDAGQILTGKALGVDENGAVMVRIDGSTRIFHSADIAIRLKR